MKFKLWLELCRQWKGIFSLQVSVAATETDDSKYDENIDVDEEREQ